MNPTVIDPPDFDQDAAWRECHEFVEKCGGLTDSDGEPNMRAASGADPGVCSCPSCGEHYWMWGRVQRCVKCAFEYPTDWWPMYSWGSSAGQQGRDSRYRHEERLQHPYYRYGFEHPVADPWKTSHTEEWRVAIRATFAPRRPCPACLGKAGCDCDKCWGRGTVALAALERKAAR